LINDLTAACHVHKFVDDTTLSEVLAGNQNSTMQDNLDDVVTQSAASLMNINVKKTKEMRLGAGARKQQYEELMLEGNVIENVKSYKLLGVHEMGCPCNCHVVKSIQANSLPETTTAC
jgi:hypothetical protein